MIAIYYRVSSKKQEYDSQKNEIENYLNKLGNPKHLIYEEKVSTKKNRPEFNRMLKDAKNGTITEIITYAFDRFGRDGKQSLIDKWSLESLGIKVSFISSSQAHLNNKELPEGMIMIMDTLAAYQARTERDYLSTRIKSGLDAARKRGQKLGRKPIADEIKMAIAEEIAHGFKIAEIAHKFGVSDKTVQRIKNANKKLA